MTALRRNKLTLVNLVRLLGIFRKKKRKKGRAFISKISGYRKWATEQEL